MRLFSKKLSGGYNGWRNKQTWLVSAWINNDEMFYQVLAQAYQLSGGELAQAEWLNRQFWDYLNRQVDCCDLFLDLLFDSYSRID